jgi:Trypsin-co-occurring domain 1
MKQLVEFQVDDEGSVVLVEVEEPVQGATQRVALNPGRLAYQATKSFTEALAKSVKPVASAIIQEMRSLDEPPDEIEATFGLTMSMEAGAVITAGSGANFSITLKWSKKT